MSETPKVLVIGAGPGGYVSAIRLGQLGVPTALVEKSALGGACLNWGCIPSKALLAATAVLADVAHGRKAGFFKGELALDVPALMAFKDGVVKQLSGGIGLLLKKAGVQVQQGTARLLGADDRQVRVAIADERGEREASFEHVVLATGARPIEIPGFSFQEPRIWDAAGALAAKELPAELVVIGGGVIGLELGCFYQGAGSSVTVVEMLERLLPGMDLECAKEIHKLLKRRGMGFHLSTRAKGWEEASGGRMKLTLETPKGPKELLADRVLVSVGMRPVTAGLGLENVGLVPGKGGALEVDDQLRTASPRILAIGDLTGPPLLAHKASHQGLVAAEVIVGEQARWDVRAMPGVVFTDPEVGSVGETEETATAGGREVRVGRFPFAASGKALAAGHRDGFVKVIADAQSDVVLGVQAVGREITGIIAEAALAIEMGALARDLALTVHAHPTLNEALMEAAESVHGRAIHVG